jgi:hypothetical protein
MAEFVTVSNDTGQKVKIFQPELLGAHQDIGTDVGAVRVATTDSRLATLDDLKKGNQVALYSGSGKLPGLFRLDSGNESERAA